MIELDFNQSISQFMDTVSEIQKQWQDPTAQKVFLEMQSIQEHLTEISNLSVQEEMILSDMEHAIPFQDLIDYFEFVMARYSQL